MKIYHIVLPEAWAGFHGDLYEAASLIDEGFIHCSFADQLDGVIGRYYSDAANIIVLELDTNKLSSRLVTEPSTGGEVYPHIYGPINREAIVSATERDITGIKGIEEI
jgi:uncharacterized protein (DUF952 family)